MPIDTHLELWRAGPRRLLRQSRYAALLTSMHGVRLYEMRDLDKLPPGEAGAIREFIDQQRAFQQRLVATLTGDPATAGASRPELIARNSQLIWTWDYLSLALCLAWAPCSAHEVPAPGGPVDLQLQPGDNPLQVRFDPWPFASQTVTVRCEGQRLIGRFETDEQLQAALARAPWETVELELTTAASATDAG
jgi:hypothetical protein